MEAMDGDTGWYNVPSFRQYMASEEADVAEALNANFLQVLSETIWSRKDSTEGFHRHRRLARVNGEPDFILVGDEGSLFLVVEVKTKWVLPATHDDLVKKYSENHEDRRKGRPLGVSVINPLEQIFGYMSQNGLQYGVLSTYESTWFLCRLKDGPRNLLISEVVKDTGTNPFLFRCFAFIMSLARNDRASPIPVSPSPPETTVEKTATIAARTIYVNALHLVLTGVNKERTESLQTRAEELIKRQRVGKTPGGKRETDGEFWFGKVF